MSDDHRNPIDQALDVLFYAPIGLALNAEELLGQMAARGRQSVAAAKFIGRMAVQQGRTEVDKALDRIQDQAATLVEQLGALSGVARPAPSTHPVDRPAEDDTTIAADKPARPEPTAVDELLPDAAAEVAVADVNRSIPDYDSLAASQVVPRLDGLTADELEIVRGYEAAHRGRTTILTRIAQLQRQ
jgi:hypothetical protein